MAESADRDASRALRGLFDGVFGQYQRLRSEVDELQGKLAELRVTERSDYGQVTAVVGAQDELICMDVSPSVFDAPGSPPGPRTEDVQRKAHRDAHAERIAAGLFVRDAVAGSRSIEEVFAAGVTPVELAQLLDPATLQRLVPGLDEVAACDMTRLLGDPRVQQMLDQTWEAPPRGEPLLAETLVHQFAQRPDLVRMILATPELVNSLMAPPVALHHLASNQKAIDVLGDVLDDMAEHGPAVVARDVDPDVAATPLTEDQRRSDALCETPGPDPVQPGLDPARRGDPAHRR